MSQSGTTSGPAPVMRVVRTRESLDDAYASLPVPSVRSARAARAAVFTMGALHAGHIALIRAARGEVGPTGHVTVTIFVNPLQFGAGEDLERYPRSLKADLAVCAAEDVDLVFAPGADVLYPTGDPEVRIDPGQMGSILEGSVRPGHFSGVLTVVAKLLNMTRPDATFFGEKDYQQLTLVRRMVLDLDLPVKVHGVPTIRDADGELELMRVGLTPDYVALTDPALGPAPEVGPARLLLATRVGRTRLIDNSPVTLRR